VRRRIFDLCSPNHFSRFFFSMVHLFFQGGTSRQPLPFLKNSNGDTYIGFFSELFDPRLLPWFSI